MKLREMLDWDVNRVISWIAHKLGPFGFRPVYLTTSLTSTSWAGNAYSTTAKTLIDLSAVFGVPAGVRWILVRTVIRDSGSAANDCLLRLSPNNTTGTGALVNRCSGQTNDSLSDENGIVPCNADGDIYYQIQASGAGTMDIWILIWGYGW